MATPTGLKLIDNASGKEHPQDLSTKAAYAELLIGATSVQETIAAAGTPQEVAHATNMSAGQSERLTASATTGRITVTAEAGPGRYRLTVSGEYKGVNSKIPQVSVGVNGVEDANTLRQKTEPATAAYTEVNITKLLSLDVGDYVSMLADTNTNSDTVDLRALTFSLEKVADDAPRIS